MPPAPVYPPVPNPCQISYSTRSSGDVKTGEVQFVRGGGRAATIWSGALAPSLLAVNGGATSGGNTLLFSGAGRLNSILQHTQMLSGLPAYFYDAGAITVSGTSVSGQKIIGVLPPTYQAGAVSGAGLVPYTGAPIAVDMPFNSGLCVNAPSGTPGFTVSWTPEVSAAFPNP